MGTMGAEAHDVLQEPLIISDGVGFIAVVLHPQTTVFAMGVIEHGADSLRGMTLRIQRSPAKGTTGILDTESVIAQASSPARQKLVNQLGIPAILVTVYRVSAASCNVVVPLFLACDVFRLKHDAGLRIITVRGPFPDQVGNDHIVITIKDDIFLGYAIFRLACEIGDAGLPAMTDANITTECGKQTVTAEAFIAGTAGRKTVTTEDFATKLQEQIGRGQPAELNTIIVVLVTEVSTT